MLTLTGPWPVDRSVQFLCPCVASRRVSSVPRSSLLEGHQSWASLPTVTSSNLTPFAETLFPMSHVPRNRGQDLNAASGGDTTPLTADTNINKSIPLTPNDRCRSGQKAQCDSDATMNHSLYSVVILMCPGSWNGCPGALSEISLGKTVTSGSEAPDSLSLVCSRTPPVAAATLSPFLSNGT